MKNVFRLEFKRGLKSPGMKAALIMGMLVVVLHWIWMVLPKMRMNASGAYLQYDDMPYSLYVNWIGGTYSNIFPVLYYWLLPIIAVLPYGESFYHDWKNGYIKNILLRTNRKKYLLGKYVSIFLTAGIAVTLPLIIDFILTAAVLPALLPDVTTALFPIFYQSMWSNLFYTHPLIYTMLYLGIDFIFAGLMAELIFCVTNLAENVFIVLIFPFACYLFIENICCSGVLQLAAWNIRMMVMPSQPLMQSMEKIGLEILVLFLLTIVLCLKNKRRDVL